MAATAFPVSESTAWSGIPNYLTGSLVIRNGTWYMLMGAASSQNEDPATHSVWKVVNGTPKAIGFTGHNNVGACTCTGAKAGDVVTSCPRIDTVGGDAAASFQTVISVDDQIQQTDAANLSARRYLALLRRP